ncbi:MAG TPA: hypothetical protein VJ732_18395 [Bryobacteraceae bacterium]|nr:hypothetical protein [Bryobacteraceae bacterium]
MRIRYAIGFCGVALTLAAGVGGAQDLRRVHFGGLISDYSPSTVSGGPWEIRGEWSVDAAQSNTADFTASLTMETSDYGITGASQVDPANPATRNPHTHYISLTNATLSYDTSVCPANNPPTTGSGVVITGTAAISGNGSPAPFESKGASTLQVCILGGPKVQFSNVTLVFSGPATSHFGSQPIHGVVSRVSAR